MGRSTEWTALAASVYTVSNYGTNQLQVSPDFHVERCCPSGTHSWGHEGDVAPVPQSSSGTPGAARDRGSPMPLCIVPLCTQRGLRLGAPATDGSTHTHWGPQHSAHSLCPVIPVQGTSLAFFPCLVSSSYNTVTLYGYLPRISAAGKNHHRILTQTLGFGSSGLASAGLDFKPQTGSRSTVHVFLILFRPPDEPQYFPLAAEDLVHEHFSHLCWSRVC